MTSTSTDKTDTETYDPNKNFDLRKHTLDHALFVGQSVVSIGLSGNLDTPDDGQIGVWKHTTFDDQMKIAERVCTTWNFAQNLGMTNEELQDEHLRKCFKAFLKGHRKVFANSEKRK